MITDIKKASRKTLRTIRYEYDLEEVARLNCVLGAQNARELRSFMETFVMADPRYAQLPKYRQECIHAYVRGALDIMAHMQGLPAAQPPDAVQSRRRPSSNPPPPPPIAPATFIESSFSHVWDTTQSLRAAARRPPRFE
jgi:hypothetical protein